MSVSYRLPERKKRIYIADDFNPLDKNDVKLLLNRLATDIPTDFKSAANWYGLFHEASCAISEEHTILELNLSFNVNDNLAEQKLIEFEEHILSQLLNIRSDLMDIYMNSPWRSAMHSYDNDRILLDLKLRRKFTSHSISSLQIEENQIIREYKKFTHAAKASFEGKLTPVSAIIGKLNDNNVEVRKSAFLTYWSFVKEKEEQYQNYFDQLNENRSKQAEAVHANNYVDVAFAELGRIDYGIAQCHEFRNSIYHEVIPIVKELSELQKESLKTQDISPWDVSIWPHLMPEKAPANGNLDQLILSVQNISSKIHPSFGKLFNEMRKNNLLDVSPRPGKAPGAFCVTFQESGYPFVFANFGGNFRDSMTFLHEFGHAIHGYAVSNINNVLLRHPGFEFCEVASIGLELLASPFYSDFWVNKKDAKKALAFQLFHMLNFWPFMAMIDEWQHKIYTNGTMPTALERNKIWRDISRKYRPQVNWDGYEDFEELGWLSRPHIFTSPFYYIDYGIAQVGALQLWKYSKENYSKAIENYIKGLSLGAQLSLPCLFSEMGIKFDFGRKLLKELCSDMKDEILKVTF